MNQTTLEYIGGCPHCKDMDRLLTGEDRTQWAACSAHKTRWLIGGNLFSYYQDQEPIERLREVESIAFFHLVEPVRA